MATVTVDKFRERLQKLYTSWRQAKHPSLSANASHALALSTGTYAPDADIGYLKSFAVVTWLFNAELQGTLILLSTSDILLVVPPADLPALSSLSSPSSADDLPPLTVLSSEAQGDIDTVVKRAVCKGADTPAGSIATLPKELSSQKGPAAQVISSLISKLSAPYTTVNAAPFLASLLAVKDEEEATRLKRASYLSARVMRGALTEKIEKTIDEDRKTSHATLSDIAEDAIMNPAKVKLNLKSEWCDPCYPPIIQSADSRTKDRTFDLRPSAESSDENLAFGCIIVSIGARFNFYCSNVSRTLLIAPTAAQEEVYTIVLRAHEAAIQALVPGVPLKNSYAAAVKALKEGVAATAAKPNAPQLPNLATALTKNVGFGTGIEFRDSVYVLNAKNESMVEQGMIFNVSVGVQNVKDKDAGIYAVLLADTVHVRDAKLGPEVFTAQSRKDFKNISYAIQPEHAGTGDADGGGGGKKGKARSRGARDDDGDDGDSAMDGGAFADAPRGRRRGAADSTNLAEAEEEEARRKKHQEALAQRMLDRGLSRLKDGGILTIDDAKQTQKKLLDEYCAFNSATEFPPLKPRCIVVDMEHEAVIVPINGIPVPFHISTLKNATKSDEGQYSYLRVNFHTPQASVSRGLGRPDNAPKFPGFSVPQGCGAFIKEFTFRSSNPLNLNDSLRKIKELRKRMTEKATHQAEKESLVEQQTLILERGRAQLSLSDVSIRPPMAKGKNNIGILEAHQNGFRYRCRSGSVDVIYSNIRNAFFQEANKELLVLVHFHLKNEIMIGAKKAKDVQFYVQVTEAVVKLNESRRRQFDQDELEEEQQERELRNRTNKTFLKFTKEVEERYGMEFDVPYRQLEFIGAPKSNAVTLLPTVSCIVNLTEWPPFVLNLKDVEVAHFERVIFQLRMFDVVFVMKGFEDDPAATGKAAKDYWLRISSIPVEELTPLKRYLDEQNIKYYEGKASLHWNDVLKNIRSDLEDFYKEGGWNFLSAEGPHGEEGGEGSEDGEDSMEGDAEFAPESGEEWASGSESSDDSDSDASDAVRELEGDSDEGEGELDSEEEGETWEELDRRAHMEDLRKGRGSDDEGDSRRKRKKGSGGGGGGPPDGGDRRGMRRRRLRGSGDEEIVDVLSMCCGPGMSVVARKFGVWKRLVTVVQGSSLRGK